MRSDIFALITVLGIALFSASCASASTTQPFTKSGSLPCDIYAAAGTPCVAAHSTVRALFSSYNGKLYQVKRRSDSATTDIKTLTVGGYADAAAQDAFCADTFCIITVLYDQSAHGNNLTIEGPGGNGGQDSGANAAALPLIVGGHKVYGLYVSAGVGYRDNQTSGVARNGEPEGEYMVTSGMHVNSRCCFDYGNAETSGDDTGNGHMDAINISTVCFCSESGPWVRADLENGLFGGGGTNSNNSNASAFVTALVKNNGQSRLTVKGGNAQRGSLNTWSSGPEPQGGYSPMHQEGAIVLGTGGDDSNGSVGSFFEGVMTAGYPTDAADNAVQANIVSVGYRNSPDSFLANGTYLLTSVSSGKALATTNCASTNGASVDLQLPNDTTCQQWKLIRTSRGTYSITNVKNGKALNTLNCNGLKDSTNVNLQSALGTTCQQWNILSTGGNHYEIVIANNGTLLDDADCGTVNSSNVDMQRWFNTPCQQWSIAS